MVTHKVTARLQGLGNTLAFRVDEKSTGYITFESGRVIDKLPEAVMAVMARAPEGAKYFVGPIYGNDTSMPILQDNLDDALARELASQGASVKGYEFLLRDRAS